MLEREKDLPPGAVDDGQSLRDDLLFSDDEIAALEKPIETDDFKDVKAQVYPSRLTSRKTVLGLAGAIWSGIPKENRKG